MDSPKKEMEIKEKVISILTEINPRISTAVDADLLEAGYIDSFEIVNIVMELEDCFEIDIEPEEILPENFKTIDSIVKLIKKSLQFQSEGDEYL